MAAMHVFHQVRCSGGGPGFHKSNVVLRNSAHLTLRRRCYDLASVMERKDTLLAMLEDFEVTSHVVTRLSWVPCYSLTKPPLLTTHCLVIYLSS